MIWATGYRYGELLDRMQRLSPLHSIPKLTMTAHLYTVNPTSQSKEKVSCHSLVIAIGAHDMLMLD